MLTLRLEQCLEQRLEQRMELLQVCIDRSIAVRRAKATKRRVILLREFRGLEMTQTATCPYCGYSLSLMEIFYGFSRDDPDNTDTECPGCQRRFGAEVSVQGVIGQGTVSASEPELPEMIQRHRFLCPQQTLARLRDHASLEPNEIRTDNPGLFYSAYAHFGSLITAFRRIPLPYSFAEGAWQPRVETRVKYGDYLGHVATFYGKAPDTDIASISRLPLSWIRTDRRNRGIPTYAELQRQNQTDRVSRIMEYIRHLEGRL